MRKVARQQTVINVIFWANIALIGVVFLVLIAIEYVFKNY